jgi:hypothetical protein
MSFRSGDWEQSSSSCLVPHLCTDSKRNTRIHLEGIRFYTHDRGIDIVSKSYRSTPEFDGLHPRRIFVHGLCEIWRRTDNCYWFDDSTPCSSHLRVIQQYDLILGRTNRQVYGLSVCLFSRHTHDRSLLSLSEREKR